MYAYIYNIEICMYIYTYIFDNDTCTVSQHYNLSGEVHHPSPFQEALKAINSQKIAPIYSQRTLF